MPWTLYRYITKELLKLLFLSAAVLGVMISVATAIKPLIDGLLDPPLVVKFVLYLTPTMLQFALPFAGMFAATMVFARMKADNEIVACAASGMSYRSILLPVMVLGLALMFGWYFLSNTIVPTFNKKATELARKDLIRMVVSELKKGRAVRFPGPSNMVAYADFAEERELTIEEQRKLVENGARELPDRVIQLSGAALSQWSSQGTLKWEGTADVVWVFLYKRQDTTLMTFYLQRPVAYNPVDRTLIQGGDYWQDTPVPLAPLVAEKPEFLSIHDLRQRARNPELSINVQRNKQQLARAMAGEELARLIVEGISRQGSVVVQGPGRQQYRLEAGSARRIDHTVILETIGAEPVRVTSIIDGQDDRVFVAAQARLTCRGDEVEPEPRASIELTNVKVFKTALEGGRLRLIPATEDRQLSLAPARWPAPIVARFAQTGVGELARISASATYRADGPVALARTNLADTLDRLQRDIIAQLHYRAATAMGCLFILLLGAVLALWMRGRTPLVVFFWGFLLALLVVIVMNTGRSLCSDHDYHVMTGVTIIWAANLLLLIVLGLTYFRVARN